MPHIVILLKSPTISAGREIGIAGFLDSLSG